MKKRIQALLLALATALSLSVPAAAEGAAETGEALRSTEADTYSRLLSVTEVQRRLAGGTDYLDKYGVTRAKIIAELSAHEHDNYYLDTPFVGGDWQSPRGDTSYNGAPGTNCAGFVAYVLRKCGLDAKAVLATMRSNSHFTNWGSGLAYDGLASASNYMGLAESGKLIAYAFANKPAMLASGKLEKGDVVLRFWTDTWGGWDEDNHLMIFWGDTPSDDKVWQNASGRVHIGPMWAENESTFVVLKLAPLKPPAQTVAGFRDVFENEWFAEAVQFVKERELMGGTGSNEFAPYGKTLRAQAVTILWRLSGKPEPQAIHPFEDVPESQYYYQAVNWAVEEGIVSGYGNGRFGPDDSVTRQDLAVLLQKYCRYRGLSVGSGSDLSEYRDCEQIGEYAGSAMSWSHSVGLITGTDEKQLLPLSGTSRCQMAVILQRLTGLLEKAE